MPNIDIDIYIDRYILFAQASNDVAKNNKHDGVTYSLWKSKEVFIVLFWYFFYRSRTCNQYINLLSNECGQEVTNIGNNIPRKWKS